MDWQTINIVDGAGNSTATLNYSTLDKNPLIGISYYRLKQTDFDGQFAYSKIISINLDQLSDQQPKVYPNPTENTISIEGSALELEDIKLFNALGQNVTAFTTITEINQAKILVDLSSLKSGMYHIKTRTAASKVYKR